MYGIMSDTLLVLFLFCLVVQGDAFSQGPPDGRCSDGYPHHRSSTRVIIQSKDVSTCPFEIMVDSGNSYSPGQTILVTLKVKDSGQGEEFTGFLIRAKRSAGDTDELLGEFSNLNESTTRPVTYRTGSASGYGPNCLSHNSNALKAQISVMWTAPDENVGEIVIGGTVISNVETFYVGVQTNLTPNGSSVDNPNLGPVYEPVEDNSHFDFTGCGSEYGCLKSPGSCGVTDCDTIVSWRPDPDNVDNIYYELRSSHPREYTTGYVALGWSEDKLMGEDDTVTCVFDEESGNIQYGVNVPGQILYNDRRRTEGFSKLHLKREDGILYCSFSRPAEITNYWYANTKEQLVTFNLKTIDYYLEVAYGPAFSFDSPGKHDVTPAVSDKKWNFFTNTTFQAFTGDEITNFSSRGNRNNIVFAIVLMVIACYFYV